MPTASNQADGREIELYYERFGDPGAPTLLFISGLGSQCISFAEEACEMFAAEGFQVVRFDNRDVGLSSRLDDVDYRLADMAGDALAVLDAVGAEKAHILGVSMGGMIAQRLAIHHPGRVLSLTSVMSRTGERGFGDSSKEASEILMAKPPRSRDEYVDLQIRGLKVFGSKPEWVDLDAARLKYETAYDRGTSPAGVRRQFMAIVRDGSRDEELRQLRVPTLVIHGDRDQLIDPSGGRHTAEVIPGARYVEIAGMGHDFPRALWPVWREAWTSFLAEEVSADGGGRPRPTSAG
jgi:pimeloyl-ACP methyl ester carboxylesterase